MEKRTTSHTAETAPAALKPAVTQEQMQADLLVVYLYEMRMAAFLAGEGDAAVGYLHRPLPEDPDLTAGPADIGLVFADIAHSDFARTFVTLYDYAYHGLLSSEAEAMGDETGYTRAAARVFDLQWATLPEQTLQDEVVPAAERLTQVAETANARHILEGGSEPFYPFRRKRKTTSEKREYEPEEASEGELTVRQLALLAGMEEMTIRTLANPKREDALQTVNRDGRTWIDIATAKRWLQRKGKYVPVRRGWGRIDLATARLNCLQDLLDLLDTALKQQGDALPGGLPSLKKRLAKASLPVTETGRGLFFDLSPAELVARVDALAEILDLPKPLLRLRSREVLAREDLAQVQRELEALKQPAPEQRRAR